MEKGLEIVKLYYSSSKEEIYRDMFLFPVGSVFCITSRFLSTVDQPADAITLICLVFKKKNEKKYRLL